MPFDDRDKFMVLLLGVILCTFCLNVLEIIQDRGSDAICVAYCHPAESVASADSYCVCKNADGSLTAKERP
jgi:hypothetical protein